MLPFGPGSRRRGSHNSGRLSVSSSLADSLSVVNTYLLPICSQIDLLAYGCGTSFAKN